MFFENHTFLRKKLANFKGNNVICFENPFIIKKNFNRFWKKLRKFVRNQFNNNWKGNWQKFKRINQNLKDSTKIWTFNKNLKELTKMKEMNKIWKKIEIEM